MARLLLIDDDPNLLDVLALTFEDAGHQVATAEDGRAGLRHHQVAPAELIISDVNMPHLDGFSLCRRLRDDGDSVPLILLTSRDSEIDEALGLELGADDYVAKPFNSRVLVARVGSLLRRQQVRRDQQPVTLRQVGRLALDTERLEVSYDGQLVVTTVTEFRLLEALAARPGVVFTRQRLMELSRGDDSVVAERIVDTYVRRLRRKFEAVDPGFGEIETVIGAGYRWRD